MVTNRRNGYRVLPSPPFNSLFFLKSGRIIPLLCHIDGQGSNWASNEARVPRLILGLVEDNEVKWCRLCRGLDTADRTSMPGLHRTSVINWVVYLVEASFLSLRFKHIQKSSLLRVRNVYSTNLFYHN